MSRVFLGVNQVFSKSIHQSIWRTLAAGCPPPDPPPFVLRIHGTDQRDIHGHLQPPAAAATNINENVALTRDSIGAL